MMSKLIRDFNVMNFQYYAIMNLNKMVQTKEEFSGYIEEYMKYKDKVSIKVDA